VAVFGLTLGAGGLSAQEPAAERWTGSLQGNGMYLFGNVEQRILGGRGAISRSDRSAEFGIDLQGVYGDTKDAEGTRAVHKRLWLGTLTTDLSPEARVSPFIFLTVESSLEKRIRERYSGGVGAKHTFVRDDRREVSLSLAVLEERTIPIRVSGLPGERLTRWSARGRVKQAWGDRARFSHVTFWQPAVDDLSRFLIRSTTEAEYVINEAISLTTSFVDSYDSEAVSRGAGSYNDGQLVFGVRAGWR
jgi:hypothetical protein